MSETETELTGPTIDADTCYRALRSRDRRFEGRFFVGVKTTHIYCRPGCPAPLPARRNTRFFACAAAAEDAGFRACRRCRPDAAPGTPAWSGTSGTVARAVRLLLASTGESPSVEELASRLGVGSRHLRRLFVRHLGAAPRSIAQTHRAHFARRLLDDTDLPMVELALAAGFGSVRRLHAAIQRAYHVSPTELRGRARAKRGISARTQRRGAGAFTLRLPYRAPFDWDGLIAFLGPRTIPGVERVQDGTYARTFRLDGASGHFIARPDPKARALVLDVVTDRAAPLVRIAERASRLFDLAADPGVIGEALSKDRELRRLLRARPGLRVPGAWDGFECAVRAILGQQITVKGATTLAGRIAREFGRATDSGDPTLSLLFPEAGELIHSELERVGLIRSRANAIRGLARAVDAGELDFDAIIGLDVFEAAMTRLPGIGRWTAQYVAMRAAGEPDAFPASDLVLRRRLLRDDEPGTEKALLRRAERWRPWRAYAAMAAWLGPPSSEKGDPDVE